MTESVIVLAILIAGIWLARQAKTWKSGLAVAMAVLILIGLAIGARS